MRFFASLFLLLAVSVSAQPGTLDPTFGTDGRLVLRSENGSQNVGANRVLVRPDGRLVLLGGIGDDAAVISLTADGARDASFGKDGVARVSPGAQSEIVFFGATILADGSLVLAGARQGEFDDTSVALLVKLTASGARDASFGTNGLVEVGATDGSEQSLFLDVRTVSEGGLVAIGAASRAGEEDIETEFVTARFTANGALDGSFGDGGIVRAKIRGGLALFTGTFLSDGSAVLMGGVAPPDGGFFELDAALARVLPDGTLDESFGEGGQVVLDMPLPFAAVLDVQADAAGRIVGTGAALDFLEGVSEALVFRLAPDGSLDASFADGGVLLTTAGASLAQATGVALQADGKIVVSGILGTQEAPDPLVFRVAEDGAFDPTFGTDGAARVGLGEPALGADVALQRDGRIVVVGQLGVDAGSVVGAFAARLQNDGLPISREAGPSRGPLALALAGPNPFADRTALALTLDEAASVRVSAYDALGREVAVLHEGPLASGRTVLPFGGASLAPGVYVVRARAGASSVAMGVVRR